ncbi:MAG TPA: ribosome recycling factor [Anaerolineae bacterium]|nr:ribosome recycling factor [Anaerolineae bacterium]HQI85187.1 ribosome recycling factor [Anaerolineae bacterium]
MIKELMSETEERMDKTVESLEEDFKSVRTGRASPALVERVTVEYYGMPTPLNQLAAISAPEPQMLLIRPYDPSSITAIEKGILQADLGLNPGNDGRVIRVPIPRLTEERRRELVKVVKRRVEEGKVALRNIRRDALEELREYENEKLISEDDRKRGQDELQKLIDRFTAKVDESGARKEQDIMEI